MDVIGNKLTIDHSRHDKLVIVDQCIFLLDTFKNVNHIIIVNHNLRYECQNNIKLIIQLINNRPQIEKLTIIKYDILVKDLEDLQFNTTLKRFVYVNYDLHANTPLECEEFIKLLLHDKQNNLTHLTLHMYINKPILLRIIEYINTHLKLNNIRMEQCIEALDNNPANNYEDIKDNYFLYSSMIKN